MKRFIIPKIGDTKRIRPLVNAERITIESVESDKGYYCLPLFCYNSQEVELYFTLDHEGTGGLLAKLYEEIEDENFSDFDLKLKTVGAEDKIGLSYVEGKGILLVERVSKAKWPITRYELPTSKDIRDALEVYEEQKKSWKRKDWKD